MFSTLKQRTIAVYHFLKLRRPHLGVFVFLSILFLAGYLLMGIYASNTGHLSMFRPAAALATEPDGGFLAGLGDTLTGWASKLLLSAANLMIQLAIWCLHLIIEIAGYNGYLSSTAVNVGWVMVRDITNMFFVVILLLVAFGTILGLEQYEWKKMLVKFFLAAVLVNFSRVICGVIIDIGQVVMITFVNGIAATADGNLINALSMDKIAGISSGNIDPKDLVDPKNIFIASLGALVFASITLAMMMVFVFMLVSRMIVLWILIVLSPFAFVLSVIPQTQKYASQWWSEFGNHVVVGPAVVFFLWLSFAVVGGGQINTEISDHSAVSEASKTPTTDGKNMAGIGKMMDWNKMSNFAIAIGILLVGAKTSQSLGTVGGSAMSKATDFGKKVAMVASGASAAMWAGNKAKQGAAATGKWAAMNVPVVGGKSWIRRGKSIAGVAKIGWSKVSQKRDEYAKKMTDSSKKVTKAKETVQREIDSGKIKESERAKRLQEEYTKSGVTVGGLGGAFTGSGRLVGALTGMLVESAGRADKRVKNIEEAAEKEKVVEEGEYSLSSTWGGQLKRSTRARAEFAEEKQKAKGERYSMEDKGAMLEKDKYEMKNANDDLKKNQAEIKLVVDAKGSDRSTWSEDEVTKVTTAEGNIKKAQETLKEVEDRPSMGSVAAKMQLEPKKILYDQIAQESENAFAETKKGEGYIKATQFAEAGKKAAEDFLKTLKGHKMTSAFKNAAEEMRKIIEGGGNIESGLKDAGTRNAFIRQLVQTTKLKEDEDTEHIAQTRAQEAATAGIIDIPKFGKEKPSTALDPMVEEAGKRLKSLEAQDGGAMAATMIARVLKRRDDLKGKPLGDFDQASLFAAVAHITKEAWTDDTIAEISAQFTDLNAGKHTNADGTLTQQGQDIKAMKDVFGESGLGLIEERTSKVKDKDGKEVEVTTYHSQSSAEKAASLQNLVATGGDMKMVRANQAIDKKMISLSELADDAVESETGLTKKSTYREVAEQMGGKVGVGVEAGGLGMSFGDFKGGLKKSQALLQDAASTFKRAALDAGHVQMGGHQVYDRDMGMYRMNNSAAATGWMVTELGKRKGSESAQIHSYGTIDNETGELVEVSEAYTRALLAAVTSARRANILSRTSDKFSGYDIGEQRVLVEVDVKDDKGNIVNDAQGKPVKKSYGKIGGGAKKKSVTQKQAFAKNVVLKAISADSEGAKIVWGKKLGVNDDDSDEGYTKFALDIGDGKEAVTGDYYSDFLANLKDRLGSMGLSEKEMEKYKQVLEGAIATSKQKEEPHRDRARNGQERKKGKGADAPVTT